MIPQSDFADGHAHEGPGSGAIRLDGRHAFTDALRQSLLALCEPGIEEFWMVDQAFLGWPLDEAGVLEALTVWCRRAGRQAHLVGADFGAIERSFPRFASWRRDYVHCVHAWRPEVVPATGLDAMLIVGRCAVELLDRDRWQLRVSTEPAAVRAAVERAGELMQRCEPAWPVSPLGL